MAGPRNEHARKREAPEQLKLSDWYAMPGADLVTRRRQVFGLLSWYHHRVVLPNLGLLGFLVRLYLKVFGMRVKLDGRTYNLGYINRVSPWMSIDIRAAHQGEILRLLEQGDQEEPGESG